MVVGELMDIFEWKFGDVIRFGIVVRKDNYFLM